MSISRKESARREYLKHREAYITRAKKWQALNPEKKKESMAKASLKFLETHGRAVINKRQTEWRKRNPDKVKAYEKKSLSQKRAKNWRRAARIRERTYENCSVKVALLKLERFCRWCCTKLTPKNFTIDHIVALNKGGNHVPDNLAACCFLCNSGKGDKSVSDWLPTLKEVI